MVRITNCMRSMWNSSAKFKYSLLSETNDQNILAENKYLGWLDYDLVSLNLVFFHLRNDSFSKRRHPEFTIPWVFRSLVPLNCITKTKWTKNWCISLINCSYSQKKNEPHFKILLFYFKQLVINMSGTGRTGAPPGKMFLSRDSVRLRRRNASRWRRCSDWKKIRNCKCSLGDDGRMTVLDWRLWLGQDVRKCRNRRIFRYFPRWNQTNNFFLEDILLKSLLAHLKVTWQLTELCILISFMVDRFHDLSLSVGKYYTSLLKSHTCNNYCCINKEINILHYDGNQVNVSEISRNLSWLLLLLCYCLHVTSRRSLRKRGCEPKSWSSKYISWIFN